MLLALRLLLPTTTIIEIFRPFTKIRFCPRQLAPTLKRDSCDHFYWAFEKYKTDLCKVRMEAGENGIHVTLFRDTMYLSFWPLIPYFIVWSIRKLRHNTELSPSDLK